MYPAWSERISEKAGGRESGKRYVCFVEEQQHRGDLSGKFLKKEI